MLTTLTRLTPLVIVFALSPLALPPLSAAGEPCAPDTKKFCADSAKDTASIAKCLRAHRAELSDACKGQIVAAETHTSPRKACAADAEKFCKDVTPGGGRVAKCLRKHSAELSAACKEARAGNQKKKQGEGSVQEKAAQKQ